MSGYGAMIQYLWNKIKKTGRGKKGDDLHGSDIIHTGRIGEDHVAALLRKKGYKVVDRNWKCQLGEIDVVATKKEILVFGEVKTRTGGEFGAPEESVGFKKQRKLINLARYYIMENKLDNLQPRFDVFSVLVEDNGKLRSMEHIEDAFQTRGFRP